MPGPDGAVRGLPLRRSPVRLVGAKATPNSLTPEYPVGVQPGDYIIAARQDSAGGTYTHSGADYDLLYNEFNDAGAWSDCELYVVGGFYKPGDAITITPGYNHSLTAIAAFRGVDPRSPVRVATGYAPSGQGTSFAMDPVYARPGEFVMALLGHEYSYSQVVTHRMSGVVADPVFMYGSTQVGQDGILAAFGGEMQRAAPCRAEWTIGDAADTVACVLALRPAAG